MWLQCKPKSHRVLSLESRAFHRVGEAPCRQPATKSYGDALILSAYMNELRFLNAAPQPPLLPVFTPTSNRRTLQPLCQLMGAYHVDRAATRFQSYNCCKKHPQTQQLPQLSTTYSSQPLESIPECKGVSQRSQVWHSQIEKCSLHLLSIINPDCAA